MGYFFAGYIHWGAFPELHQKGYAGRAYFLLVRTLLCHLLTVHAATPRFCCPQHILRGIDGIAEPGRILAIMGPSGSGKTSLLHCLAGRRRGMTGEVRLNGAPTANHQVMRTNAGFVPQVCGL